MKRVIVIKGGSGSGNFGHAGRPGQIGGSAESDAGLVTAKLRRFGGVTYQPIVNRSPRRGMALSLHPERELIINVNDLSVAAVNAYIERNKDLLSDPANNVGGWLDMVSGKIFLDVSTVVGTREEAYKLAKQYKQEAFYDLGAGEEVRVGAHEPIVKAEGVRYLIFEMPPNPTQDEIKELVRMIKEIARKLDDR